MTSRQPGRQPALDLLVDALATYRLTVLVKDDKVSEGFRESVFRRYGPLDDENARKPSYFLGCPWCLSIWFGAVSVVGRRFAPRAWQPLSRVLAFSAVTGLLSERRSLLDR